MRDDSNYVCASSACHFRFGSTILLLLLLLLLLLSSLSSRARRLARSLGIPALGADHYP
jgi:hypothetical protein